MNINKPKVRRGINKGKLGRPKGTLKYITPFGNTKIDIYSYRKIHLISKLIFSNKYLMKEEIKDPYIFIPLKKGRPKGTTKYYNNLGMPIVVNEWRVLNKYSTMMGIKNRNVRIKNQIKKDCLRYDKSFNFILNLKIKCAICGFDKFLCDIHHKDKNPNNNIESNLIGLCPTCHMGLHRKYIILNSDNIYIYNPDTEGLIKELKNETCILC